MSLSPVFAVIFTRYLEILAYTDICTCARNFRSGRVKVGCIFTLIGTGGVFRVEILAMYSYTNNVCSPVPHTLPDPGGLSNVYIFSSPMCKKLYLVVVVICASLIVKEVKHLFESF